MESAISQIRELYAKANAQERTQIQDQLRDLKYELYTDWEVLFGIAFGPLEWALIHVGINLDIFTKLNSSSSSLTADSLAASTGAAPGLLRHLLRGMASFGFMEQTGKDTFAANRVTKALNNPHIAGAAPHIADFHYPVAGVLAEYLKERNYKDITDQKDLPFHKAVKTDLAPFDWMKANPEQMKSLGHIMMLDAVIYWVTTYPVVDAVKDFKVTSDNALLVDVGGGFGAQSIAFKKAFPDLSGRVVVQDLASTLMHVPEPKTEGIEYLEHDFFTPQTIIGAKFYYLRNVLHDWPAEDCVRILNNLVPAMSADSRIMIDEVVLPTSKIPWQVAAMDVGMLIALGGAERTRDDWEELVGRAGLKILHVHTYDEDKFRSIIAAVPV